MTPRKRDVTSLLDFLQVLYSEVDGSSELVLSCLFCDKPDHLYINREHGAWICHKCGESGSLKKFEQALLEWIVSSSIRKGSIPDDYWAEHRGLNYETIDGARLGYYPPLERYTIPYLGEDGEILNISFRSSREDQDPKYIRLPGVGNQPYCRGPRDAELVVITEGEVDALSVHQSMPNVLVLGIPGATSANAKLLEYIPSGARVVAVMDADRPGAGAARKLSTLIPSIRFGRLVEGIKDINELLVGWGENAVSSCINAAEPATSGSDPEAGGGNVSSVLPSTVYLSLPDETTRWLVEGLWMDQALGFVAGIPKALKSTLALHIAYHISTGHPFAGHRILKPGNVVLVQEEDNDYIIRSRLRTINSGTGSPNLYIRTPGSSGSHFRVDDDSSFEYLDDVARELQPVLIVLDPLANMHSLEDENQAGAINSILERLRHLRDLRKCGIMVVHHMRKGTDDGADGSGQRMRGSSVFHAKSECALYIAKHGNLLRVTVENKITPTRIVELRYDGKEFKVEDE